MRSFTIGGAILATLTLAAIVWATESDELRERAQAMRREADELAERGHGEEAERLEREALAMLEEAEKLESRGPQRAQIRELEMRLDQLRQEEAELREPGGSDEKLADVRQEAERLERMLHELTHRDDPGHPQSHREAAERLDHMRAAIEHLRHAGLPDVAEHVAHRAEAMERELHERRDEGHEGRRHRDPHEPLHEVLQQLEEVRKEVGRLRDEVNELRER